MDRRKRIFAMTAVQAPIGAGQSAATPVAAPGDVIGRTGA